MAGRDDMTEVIIITLLLTAGVWLVRMWRRAQAHVRGIEYDAGAEGPLPIIRLGGLLRRWWSGIWGWVDRRRNAKRASRAESLETE